MDPWYTLYMRASVLHSSQWSRIFPWYPHHPSHTPTTTTLLPPTPLLSFFIPLSIHLSFHMPSHWSVVSSPTRSLSSFSSPLVSYHSILPWVKPYIFTSNCPPYLPSLILPLPPCNGPSERGTCDQRGGSLLGVPLQCHCTLICLLRFHIDFVLNKGKYKRNEVPEVTWNKKKRRGKGKIEWGEKRGKVPLRIKSMSWVPGGLRVLSGGECTLSELKKEGSRDGSSARFFI